MCQRRHLSLEAETFLFESGVFVRKAWRIAGFGDGWNLDVSIWVLRAWFWSLDPVIHGVFGNIFWRSTSSLLGVSLLAVFALSNVSCGVLVRNNVTGNEYHQKSTAFLLLAPLATKSSSV